MEPAREVAAGLAAAGILVVQQGGAAVDLATVTGAVRLARGPKWDPAS